MRRKKMLRPFMVDQPVEEITPTQPSDSEEVDDNLPNDNEDNGEDIDDDEIGSFDDSIFDPMQQFTQLLVTEAGVPIVDVLQGIQEAIEKQNKILYKLVSTIESKHCGKA